MNHKKFNAKEITELALFCAIIVVLGMTPLGYIPMPGFKITTVHVPVIIGSVLFGWKKGAVLGFIFGLTSLISGTINVVPMSIFFSPIISGNLLSLVVCFIPRILVGIVPYFVFYLFKERNKNAKKIGLILTGISGSLTNTIFVMGFIYLFFKEKYEIIAGESFNTILTFIVASVGVNAIVEAIAASIFTFAICNILLKRR